MKDKELGRRGEQLAAVYITKAKNYKILMRNYRTRMGEIDIIAQDGPSLIFIEVKTRNSAHCGRPAEAVEKHKQYKIRKVAESYLARHQAWNRPCRFDVIEILTRQGKEPLINHITNAFLVKS
jgi:putative endonuclease